MASNNFIKTFFFLIKREFKRFWANSIVRMIFIGAPLAYGILFGFVYQKGKVTGLPIIVVDKDNTPMSNKMIDMFNDNETIYVVKLDPESTDLKHQMIKLKADALVIIPDNFEADLLQKRYPEVNVNINTANILTANYASKAIQLTLGTMSAGISMEALKKKGMPASIAAGQYEPFKVNYIRLFNSSANYMNFLWPGMLATIVQQVILLALALSFASEFESNTFKTEFLTYTRSAFNALMIKSIPFWLMTLCLWGIFNLMHIYFRIPMVENTGSLLVLGSLFVISTSFMGAMVSVLIPSQLKATEILMVVATPSFVVSGFTWPLSQMPLWIQYLSKAIPLTHFLDGFRILLMQQGSLSDIPSQLNGLIVLTLVYGIISFIAIKLKIRKTLKATTT